MTFAPAFSMRLISASDLTNASAFQVFFGTTPVSSVERNDTVSDARKNSPDRSSRTSAPVVPWRVARQRHQNDAAVAEHVALAVDRIDRRAVLPLGRDIALRLRALGARRFDLLAMNNETRALEEGIAAAMVGMQMRAYDDIDIVADEPDAAERVHDIVAGLP